MSDGKGVDEKGVDGKESGEKESGEKEFGGFEFDHDSTTATREDGGYDHTASDERIGVLFDLFDGVITPDDRPREFPGGSASLDRAEDMEVNPPPEYALEGLGGLRDPTKDDVQVYREQFGYLRAYFRSRPADYADYQRTLNQARMAISYDEYLANSALYAIAVGIVGALLGIALTFALSVSGVLGTIESPYGITGPVASFVGQYRVFFGGLALTLMLGGLFGGVTWALLKYYPASKVVTRTQKIDVMLPHAIVYMYALSYGGMALTDVIRSISEAEDTYGEMALESDQIVRDIEIFGNDLITALANTRNLTPSDNFEQFLDDLLSVLDSGGEVTPFLESEAQGYLEEAMDSQEDFLETLSIMSEVFIVGFVAAPLFLVVILVVISLVGGNTLTQISLLVYAVIPVGMVAFLVLISTLSEPYVQKGRVDAPSRSRFDVPAELVEADERFEAYQKQRRLDVIKEYLANPLEPVRQEPLYVLALSVPGALFFMAVLVFSGTVPISMDAFIELPLLTTVGLVVVPLLIATIPLSYYHERRSRRENIMSRRLPDTLNILSSANKMGITLTDGLSLVVRSSSGLVASELRKVRNDIIWNNDTSGALLAFGSRLRIPQLARTTRLLAEGLESTGDLSRVLSIAAEDARARYKLERARTREMTSYIAIVVIGYLVYLLVVLLLDAAYLGPIAEAAAGQGDPGPDGTQVPLSFTNVPVATYQAIFFHSAVIQGFGSGLLAGKLADNTLLSGLKYAIFLVGLATVAFAFV
ncbi:type II secretion system F family protein [Natronomonas sp. EA1]|uniref:type II secretion system F family protein n=1 Tax=Natronomonas sp. EA1 TaxID=3421655 RepID=UPI003EB93C47